MTRFAIDPAGLMDRPARACSADRRRSPRIPPATKSNGTPGHGRFRSSRRDSPAASNHPAAQCRSTPVAFSDSKGRRADRSPGVDSQIPRQGHGHQARRQRDRRRRRPAPPADRHRVHGNRRHAAGRGPRRRRGHQPGHGRRRASSRASSRAAATPTTPRCDIVERVLAYETNEHIAERIEDFGGRAAPLNFRTTNVLLGERLTLQDDQGKPVDLG